MNDITTAAFFDELDSIEKEAGIQFLAGAGRALGGMARAGKQMVQHGIQAGGGGSGLRGAMGNLGRAAQGGWTKGVAGMQQVGQAAGGGMAGQAAMAGKLWGGARQAMAPMATAFQTAAR